MMHFGRDTTSSSAITSAECHELEERIARCTSRWELTELEHSIAMMWAHTPEEQDVNEWSLLALAVSIHQRRRELAASRH